MLADSLKILLASNCAYYLRAHAFHWNVEGPDFGELHKFFGKIYTDAYSALDATAEFIRYLDEYAPGSFERYTELSTIKDQTKIPRARLMIEELLANTQQMIDLLNQCFAEAEQENQQGIADFVSQRLAQHGKYYWQLRSYLKDERA